MDSLNAADGSLPPVDLAVATEEPRLPRIRRADAMTTSEVRFNATKNGEASLLEIATHERKSVLDRVRGLLFGLEIEILKVESIVTENGLLERFEIAERDGAVISRSRAAVIRSTVRKALQARGKTRRTRGRAA